MIAKAIYLIAVTSLLLETSLPCQANLGDNLSQSVARYGKPISQGKGDSTNAGLPWYAFKSGKFEIQETFINGICWLEQRWLEDRKPILESDQLAILKENAGNETWGNPKDENGARDWVRTDGATAAYTPIGNKSIGNEMFLSLATARKH